MSTTAPDSLLSSLSLSNDDGSRVEVDSCPICALPATKSCSGCSSIFYCSSQHQKEHWSTHKTSCRPYLIKRNEIYGRYLVAAKDLPQGTIVMTEPPLVVGPKRSTIPLCLGCHAKTDCSYKCSSCGFPVCNENCEKNPNHSENECRIFQGGHPIGSKINDPSSLHPAYESILPIRCLLLREKDPIKWASLNTMEHHNDFRKNLTQLWNRNEINTVKLIREFLKQNQFEGELIHSVMGYIDVNGFEVMNGSSSICGIYPSAALMAHNCCPNTHHATTSAPNFHMVVRTSVPIRKGEIISTRYVDSLKGTYWRREFLKETKYFDCMCPRCKDPSEFGTFLSGVKCNSCGEGFLLPDNTLDCNSVWKCYTNNNLSSCPNMLKSEKIMNITAKFKKELEAAESCTKGSRISRLERVLKKGLKIFHPNHFLLIGILKLLRKLYVAEVGVGAGIDSLDVEMLERKRDVCLQLLHVLDLIEPGLTRERGVTLFHLFKAEYPLNKIHLRNKKLKKEEFIEKCQDILAYLQTAKETLELDRLIVDHPHLALAVDESVDLIYDEMQMEREKK